MKPCPHCGSEDGFYVLAVPRGRVTHYYDGEGNLDETSWDRVYSEPRSKVVRCTGCNRIRKDVRREDPTRVVEVEDVGD